MGRQETTLERLTNPTLSRRACSSVRATVVERGVVKQWLLSHPNSSDSHHTNPCFTWVVRERRYYEVYNRVLALFDQQIERFGQERFAQRLAELRALKASVPPPPPPPPLASPPLPNATATGSAAAVGAGEGAAVEGGGNTTQPAAVGGGAGEGAGVEGGGNTTQPAAVGAGAGEGAAVEGGGNTTQPPRRRTLLKTVLVPKVRTPQ